MRVNQHGFTLVEALVTLGVLAVGFVASMQALEHMNRQVRRSDLKVQAMSSLEHFRQQLSSPQSCAQAFGLADGAGPVLQGLPAVSGGPDSATIPLERMSLGARSVLHGSSLGPFSITSMELYFGRPVQANQYLAHLTVTLTDSSHNWVAHRMETLRRSRIAIEPALALALQREERALSEGESPAPPAMSSHTLNLPVYVELMTEGEGANAVTRMSRCWVGQQSNPRESCAALGGEWFAYPEGSEFRDRCRFETSFRLAQFELPLNVSTNDPLRREEETTLGRERSPGERAPPLTAAQMQSRPTSCFYRANGSARTSEWKCPNVHSSTSWMCAYHENVGWAVTYFQANAQRNGGQWQRTGANSTLRIAYRCTEGVQIQVPTETFVVLSHDQKLTDMMPPAEVPSDSEQRRQLDRDLLPSVMTCNHVFGSDQSINCSNSVDPLSALAKNAGSCVWVEQSYGNASANVLAQNTANGCAAGYATNRNAPTTDQCISAYNYTGWIYVTQPPVKSIRNSGGSTLTTVREAQGYPCLSVTANLGVARTLEGIGTQIVSGTSTLPPKPMLGTSADTDFDFSKLKQCIYRPNSAHEATYNMNIAAETVREMVYTCNNDGLNFRNPDGSYNPGVINGSGESMFRQGRCMYVEGARLSNGVSAATAPAGQRLYTGWVYLHADVNQAWLDHVEYTTPLNDIEAQGGVINPAVPGRPQGLILKAAMTNPPLLNATPCADLRSATAGGSPTHTVRMQSP